MLLSPYRYSAKYRPLSTGLVAETTMSCWGYILVPARKKLNELSSPSPKRYQWSEAGRWEGILSQMGHRSHSQEWS